ncbi:hypothetical protein [Amycolatopsis sp. VC5-11]|uniref:hypothetical protein n=1 Tax=Amycolatopsis sp. VC5-11 TaxID=3120156 RepID=UPI0030082E8F
MNKHIVRGLVIGGFLAAGVATATGAASAAPAAQQGVAVADRDLSVPVAAGGHEPLPAAAAPDTREGAVAPAGTRIWSATGSRTREGAVSPAGTRIWFLAGGNARDAAAAPSSYVH